ncbi:MAG: aminotransferase class III-fold pyridoxal phosphate-dependent enzyme [Isosphaeraceae bacterium]
MMTRLTSHDGGAATWNLAEAKSRLSEVVNLAPTEGPQTITQRNDTVVLISAEKYAELTGKKLDFKEYLLCGVGPRRTRFDAGRDADARRRTVKALLDTNILAELVKPNGNPAVHSALAEIPTPNLFLSVLTVGELAKGTALAPGQKKKRLAKWLIGIESEYGERILTLDSETAPTLGELMARPEKGESSSCPSTDSFAATALRHGLHVEPIGHTGGVIDPPEEYLPKLRELCDKHNVLLIFDEIITGIGRTGHMFAAETFGVTPDVLCVAKGLSGGIAPISAMICRRHIADAFWGPAGVNPGFVEGHTFEGNPISCAAAIAVLDEILTNDLCGNSRAQGERLRGHFEALSNKYPVIGDIRGKGLFQAVEFVRDRATRERFPAGQEIGLKVGRRALELGLLCRFDPHWIAFGPPLVSTPDDIDAMVAVLDQSLGEVLGGTSL